jgi:hypothetical protein
MNPVEFLVKGGGLVFGRIQFEDLGRLPDSPNDAAPRLTEFIDKFGKSSSLCGVF